MRRRRPVMRTAGRTAVVAGTATAVSGRVARRQRSKATEQMEQSTPPPTSAAAPAPATPAPAGATAASTAGGISEESLDRLKSLAELRDQGVLTEAEFADQKAKILDASR